MERRKLGEGFYFTYDFRPNELGGFGMEYDVEIVLQSYIDKDDNLIQPFTQSA